MHGYIYIKEPNEHKTILSMTTLTGEEAQEGKGNMENAEKIKTM